MKHSMLVWGAIASLAVAAIVVLAGLVGVHSDMQLLADPYRAAGAGFMWGVAICGIRNWLIGKRRRAL